MLFFHIIYYNYYTIYEHQNNITDEYCFLFFVFFYFYPIIEKFSIKEFYNKSKFTLGFIRLFYFFYANSICSWLPPIRRPTILYISLHLHIYNIILTSLSCQSPLHHQYRNQAPRRFSI